MSAVVLAGVGKTYSSVEGKVEALGPVSFSMDAGETLSIVGPSGCGKSTLLRLISGLEPASQGTIRVGDREVREPLDDVGIVFQRDLLLDWRNIIDNVLLPAEFRRHDRDAARRRGHDLLRELGIADFATRRPWELSGGMRQRAAIARALLCKPSMLLLDEPFSALDALTRDQMNVTLQTVQIHEHVTMVLITHSILEAIFLADRVIVMSARPGRILDEIEVPFPRPRRLSLREDSAFAEIARRIRIHFEQAGVLVG